MRVEAIDRVLDASNLETEDARDRVDRHEVAECVLRLQTAPRLRPGREQRLARAAS